MFVIAWVSKGVYEWDRLVCCRSVLGGVCVGVTVGVVGIVWVCMVLIA